MTAEPTTIPLALVVALAAALGQSAAPAVADRDAHGGFTGETKPLLYVTDVEESAPYYRDVLGFEFEGYAELDGDPYYAEMAAGDQKFGLHEALAQGDESRIGQQRLYFRVRDLDAHRRRVAARDGEPGEVIETAWMDFFIARDPDGSQIVFAITDPERHSIDPW